MHQALKSQKLLSRIYLLTSIGDFISLFAILVLVHEQTQNLALASYAVALKSLGLMIGAITSPFVLSRFSHRKILIYSQMMSGAIMTGIFAIAMSSHPNIALIYGLMTLQTVFKLYFDASRETLSKSFGEAHEQRSLQSDLLQNLYGAQILGPLLSFILIRTMGPQIPILIDGISFFVAAYLCTKLERVADERSCPVSILSPIKYLRQPGALQSLFIIRAILYWVPVAIYNFFLFSVVNKMYRLELLNSVWSYMAIGVGSIIASTLLKGTNQGFFPKLQKYLKCRTDTEIAFAALFVLGITRLMLISLPNFGLVILVIAIGGLCNGFNAATTQAMRRKLTTQAQFPEVVALETVVAKFADWAVGSLCLIAVTQGVLDFRTGILISSAALFGLSLLHLRGELKGV